MAIPHPVPEGAANAPDERTTSRPARWAVKAMAILVPMALFLVGTWSVPLAVFGPERALVPGDLGDARFNNYVLEHFHQYITGKEASYWDAPMMYPEKNTIARSDNLLGTAPIYSLFRSNGFSRESAFQLWLLMLFSLNFWCCFIALREWAGDAVLAACGAFIFAYGIHNQGELPHAQMFPKFMVPLAFLFLWRHLRTGSVRQLVWATAAVVYQIYCGAYLGLMLIYGLFFLLLGHVIAHRGEWLQHFRQRAFTPRVLLVLVGPGIALLPLALPYWSAQGIGEDRTFKDIAGAVPRLSSLFSSHPAAMSWETLDHVGSGLPGSGDHHLFMGGIPWLAVLAVPLLLWAWRKDRMAHRTLLALSVAFAGSWLFCLRFGGLSLYELVFRIPGFSDMRSITRIIHVEAMFFLILLMLVLRKAVQQRRTRWAVMLLLPLLVVQDHRWNMRHIPRFNKYDAQELVDRIAMDISTQRDTSHKVIAYMPLRNIAEKEDLHQGTIDLQLSAMLAAQQLHVTTVNGYSGSYPPGFLPFFDHMDPRGLLIWCEHKGIPSSLVQPINNIGFVPTDTLVIWLQAFNGKFICANSMKDDLAIADRDAPQAWETFVHVSLPGERHAFLAHNGDYLCAEIAEEKQLSATGERLGDFGLFTLVDAGGGTVGIKAHNGRYLSVDSTSFRVFASDTVIGPHARFRILPADPLP